MKCADLKPPLIDLEACDKATGRKQGNIPVQRERLSEGDYTYCVYWIRKTNHTDPSSQGYIGITKDLKERLRSHRNNKKITKLTSSIKKNKWNNLVVDIVQEGLSLEEALEVERRFRPDPDIGWNHQAGGEVGVSSEWYRDSDNLEKHRKATSIATRKAIADKDSTEARSQRAKDSWKKTRKKREGLFLGEKNPRAVLKEEEVKEIKYVLIPEGRTNKEISEIYGVRPHVISFIRRGKTWKHV